MASRLPMATRVRRPSTLQRVLPRGLRLSDLAADRRGAPLLVLGLLVVASLVAVVPLSSAQGTGGTVPDDARGETSLDDRAYLVADAGGQGPRDLVAVVGPADEASADDAAADDAAAEVAPAEEGPFSTDGTLIKPYTVDTTAPEGIEDRVRLYRVRPGDSLSGIANRFGVELMTIWWANKLQRTDALRVGQQLVIPPADGVLHTVVEGDTLASVARKYKVQARQITRFNQIEGNVLVLGQVLLIPGGKGKPIPAPKPVYVARPGSSGGSSGGSCSSCSYGGSMHWPVAGGHISQYFHYGHYGLDIAAPYGTPVLASAGGSVIFAGWRDNGGGYQVWISHGNGVYTTYNHMSSVSVGGGASVGAGQQVGRIGATGWATGPHLHFEVWIGQIWNGGYRVNPLNYL